MANDSDKLSASDINKLSNVINEAKKLFEQHEKILKQTLEAENAIIARRMEGLKEYNDSYSKLLNQVTREQNSLNTSIQQIAKAGKQAAENAEKASKSNRNRQRPNTSVTTNRVVSDEEKDRAKEGKPNRADKRDEYFVEQYQDDKKHDKNSIIEESVLTEKLKTKFQTLYENNLAKRDSIEARQYDLYIARNKAKTLQEYKLTEIRLDNIQKITDKELAAQNLYNEMIAEQTYSESDKYADEYGQNREAEAAAIAHENALQELKRRRTEELLNAEYEIRKKNNGELSAKDYADAMKIVNDKYAVTTENIDKIKKEQAKEDLREQKKAAKSKKDTAEAKQQADAAQRTNDINSLLGSKTNWADRKKAWKNLTQDETGDFDKGKATAASVAAVDKMVHALGSAIAKLNSKVDEIGNYKGFIDTRLAGSKADTSKGSYWDQIVKDMASVGAVNPFFKQADFANNIKSLVDSGIAFDLEQRAFLMTIKDKIATTFEVADGTLLKLIRIQQEDSTAGRLGMEAALNSFLNEMYENTEYLKTVAKSVRDSLAEMESLMSGAEATEVEYQVQKWMGSLYSVGMSDTAVNAISSALGQIAAGQIEGLTGNGAGNLLIMAANEAGIPIADILTGGVTSEETNELLQAAVNYLAELSKSSKDNRVVQQQLANVFGVKASDLKAATNLAQGSTINNIYKNSMTYSNMLYKLNEMAGTMLDRTSISEIMTNVWENVQYSLAGSMASNPISYMLFKTATMLDETVGGIPIPGINIMGNMVNLQTTIADLIRVGALSSGVVSSFGSLVSGLGNSFSGRAMLEELGISSGDNIKITPRGDGSSQKPSGGKKSTSGSGYVGNSNASDIKDSTLQEADDSEKKQMIEAKEEEGPNQVDTLNQTVIQIYELLNDVASGKSSFNVKVSGYGLTSSSGGSQGGVSGILNNSNSGMSSGGSSKGNVNFGGWTTL